MRRIGLVALCTVIVLAAAPDPAGGAIKSGRNAIGDSVMLGAKQALQRRGVKVNADQSRQFPDAVGLVRRMRRAGTLRRKVIIHLGTNGILVEARDCDAIARIAGGNRKVFLVTNTGPTQYPGIRRTQNRRLKACARRNANTSIIGWYTYSRGHGSWFYSDGMHLKPDGRRAYARFLDRRTS